MYFPWKKPSDFAPAVIYKFTDLQEKAEIYKRTSWLAGSVNKRNNRPIFLKERLSTTNQVIKTFAESNGLITPTWNFQLKNFRTTNSGFTRSVELSSCQRIDDIGSKDLEKVSKDSRNVSFRRKRVEKSRNSSNGCAVAARKGVDNDNIDNNGPGKTRDDELSKLLRQLRNSTDDKCLKFSHRITESSHLGSMKDFLNLPC